MLSNICEFDNTGNLCFYIEHYLIKQKQQQLLMFESMTESTAKCRAYFTVVHSHGAAYFTIRAKTQVARVNTYSGVL